MTGNGQPPFSVVLPVYQGDNPQYLDTAISSLEAQTVQPTELVVVEDGPLTAKLSSVLKDWSERFSGNFRRHRHETNQGLSVALRTGVEKATHDIVGRMDADDLSVPKRFERQLGYLSNNPGVDVLGGYIAEFSTDPDETDALRTVPLNHDAIRRQARFRSPMNHGSVVFRKGSVLEAGNYRPVGRMEDYDLWVRLLLQGATFANIPEVLLKARAGEELYGRRGGWEYACEEVRMHVEFFRWGFTTIPVFLFNLIFRTGLRLLPNRFRELIYRALARDGVR